MNTAEIDKEWLQLIIEAKNLGIEKKEILDYLLNKGVKGLKKESYHVVEGES